MHRSRSAKNIAALLSHDVGTMIVMAGTNDTHLSKIELDKRMYNLRVIILCAHTAQSKKDNYFIAIFKGVL